MRETIMAVAVADKSHAERNRNIKPGSRLRRQGDPRRLRIFYFGSISTRVPVERMDALAHTWRFENRNRSDE